MTIPATKAELLEARALSILAGAIPLADYPLYSEQEWKDEAQAVIDTGDDTGLRWMLAEQERHDATCRREAVDAYHGRGAWNRHVIEAALREPANDLMLRVARTQGADQ